MTAKTKLLLVDSNILVYAINTDSPKHQAAQTFLLQHSANLAVTHQNITETLRVLTHAQFAQPMTINDALHAVEGITRACHIITPDETALHLMSQIVKHANITSNQVFDAYLAATALAANITTIATDNTKDFQKLKTQLRLVNPFDR